MANDYLPKSGAELNIWLGTVQGKLAAHGPTYGLSQPFLCCPRHSWRPRLNWQMGQQIILQGYFFKICPGRDRSHPGSPTIYSRSFQK